MSVQQEQFAEKAVKDLATALLEEQRQQKSAGQVVEIVRWQLALIIGLTSVLSAVLTAVLVRVALK